MVETRTKDKVGEVVVTEVTERQQHKAKYPQTGRAQRHAEGGGGKETPLNMATVEGPQKAD